jgi:hypothetical protein
MSLPTCVAIGVAWCVILPATPASATEMPAVSLIENCRAYLREPESAPALRCTAYLHGFLDGTRAGKSNAARTLRTPFGSRVARYPSARPIFCLPPDIAVAEIIQNLLLEAETGSRAQEHGHELLGEVLRLHYPCVRQAEPPTRRADR